MNLINCHVFPVSISHTPIEEYLESLNIVHRDLACRNILIGAEKIVKVTDFGMSRIVTKEDPVYVKTTHGNLPWNWMALESLLDYQFTTASDVWSLEW